MSNLDQNIYLYYLTRFSYNPILIQKWYKLCNVYDKINLQESLILLISVATSINAKVNLIIVIFYTGEIVFFTPVSFSIWKLFI